MEVDKAAADDEAKRHAAEKQRVENLLALIGWPQSGSIITRMRRNGARPASPWPSLW
jgi:hypothetical protein